MPATLADLARHDLVGFDAETPALRAMLAHLPGLDRTSFALRTDSNLAQLAAIWAGFGIGLCHVTMAQADPMLGRVLETVGFALPLWIVMHEDLKTNARYRLVSAAWCRRFRRSLDRVAFDPGIPILLSQSELCLAP